MRPIEKGNPEVVYWLKKEIISGIWVKLKKPTFTALLWNYYISITAAGETIPVTFTYIASHCCFVHVF